MKLTVVIPTHDRADRITHSLGSVLKQERVPDEVIVVDDFADDATRLIVEEAAKNSSVPVRYLRNSENPGACGSRNQGAQLATHEWLALLDDDDSWDPTYLKVVEQTAAQYPADFYITSIAELRNGRQSKVRWSSDGIGKDNAFDQSGIMTGSNIVVSRNAYMAVDGFDPSVKVNNDWDMFYRLVAQGFLYKSIETPLVYWQHHEGVRIASETLRRAAGLEDFVRRYNHSMPVKLKVELLSVASKIRRKRAHTKRERLSIYLHYLAKVGPAAALTHAIRHRLRPNSKKAA